MEPRKVRSRSEDDMDDRVSQADITLAHQEYKREMAESLAALREYGERLNRTGWSDAWREYVDKNRNTSRPKHRQDDDERLREYVSTSCASDGGNGIPLECCVGAVPTDS